MRGIFDQWHQRLFSALHSRTLLYNACWEDPALDRQALALGADDSVLVITSGGCNALDYAIAGAGRVHAVDMNPQQNALLDLKLAAAKALEYEDFWKMFGEGVHPRFRDIYTDVLRPLLPAEAKRNWDKRQNWFDPEAGGLYFRGLSGVIARGFRGWMRARPGLKRGINALLETTSIEEQRAVWDAQVAPELWTGGLNWALRRRWFMCLCGVPTAQMAEVERAGGESGVSGFVRDCVDRVFRTLPLTDNYFWTVYLRGRYTPECRPEYLSPAGWATLHAGGTAAVSTYTGTITGFLAGHEAPISRFVLLDHLDWMAEARPDLLVEEWEWIMRRATPQARAIWRSAHPRPEWMTNQVMPDGRLLSDRWVLHEDLAARLHQSDRVGTYGGFHIADLRELAKQVAA